MEESPAPSEHKTLKKVPKHLICYVLIDNVPVSYQRLYKQQAERVNLILDYVTKFYYTVNEGLGQKLCVSHLAEKLNINVGVLSRLLIQMANCRRYMVKEKDKWKVLRNKPFILLQQKPKHIQKEYWNKKTPVYVLPFDKGYMGLKKEGD